MKLLCNFFGITLRYGCSSVNLLHNFPKNTSDELLLNNVLAWRENSRRLQSETQTMNQKQIKHGLTDMKRLSTAVGFESCAQQCKLNVRPTMIVELILKYQLTIIV